MAIDLSGQKFGRLMVVGLGDPQIGKNGELTRMWDCLCDCGNYALVRTSNLRHKQTSSCGCLKARRNNLSRTTEYRTWIAMNRRCHNPNYHEYSLYGGRGITVCAEWRHDFAAFLAHVGEKSSADLSLNRIDNSRGYEPGNVEWVNRVDQANNRRSSRLIEFNGEMATLAQWAFRLGYAYGCLEARLDQRHWPVDKAFTVPSRRHIRRSTSTILGK